MADQELLKRYVETADQSAFAQVARRHVNWVNSMARRIVKDEALAADVTQAVFILLARRARSVAGKSVLSTWLFNVTRYTSLNARRTEARRVVSSDHEWCTLTLAASGNHFAVWVNGYQVTDWTDERPTDENPRKGRRDAPGHISLQGHDGTTDLSFRGMRVQPLP